MPVAVSVYICVHALAVEWLFSPSLQKHGVQCGRDHVRCQCPH